jgi:hypothetical protein
MDTLTLVGKSTVMSAVAPHPRILNSPFIRIPLFKLTKSPGVVKSRPGAISNRKASPSPSRSLKPLSRTQVGQSLMSRPKNTPKMVSNVKEEMAM